MKTNRLIPTLFFGLLLSLGLLVGCEDNDPVEDLGDNVEEFGEDLQEAADDTRRKIEDATD
tara:strand:- start:9977 stop:10159 length:183 start_codon:yes stop_codon:yes gene_type:complete